MKNGHNNGMGQPVEDVIVKLYHGLQEKQPTIHTKGKPTEPQGPSCTH